MSARRASRGDWIAPCPPGLSTRGYQDAGPPGLNIAPIARSHTPSSRDTTPNLPPPARPGLGGLAGGVKGHRFGEVRSLLSAIAGGRPGRCEGEAARTDRGTDGRSLGSWRLSLASGPGLPISRNRPQKRSVTPLRSACCAPLRVFQVGINPRRARPRRPRLPGVSMRRSGCGVLRDREVPRRCASPSIPRGTGGRLGKSGVPSPG
jgi:hypothetical protein